MPTVFANSRLILTQADGLQHMCTVPDVCKTPVPGGGPVPIPYPNIAMNATLVSGSVSVKVAGSSAALAGSKLSTSSGDEPGSVGGVSSGINQGPMSWATTSPDVLIEGAGVARFMDTTLHNGSSANTTGLAMGWPKPG